MGRSADYAPLMFWENPMQLSNSLADVHVVEVATYIPGPACTRILGSLGATITKVERPGGDPMRRLEPLGPGGESPLFAPLNEGKVSIELDLKSPAGAAELRQLAAGADVLVDGSRPGALARLGLGAAELRALNPRLIVCAISGFGQVGPLAERAGHDLNFAALSGLLAMTYAGEAREPAMPGTQLADLVSGLAAATAILAALQARAVTGKGSVIDVPMLAAARWLMAPWIAAARAGVEVSAEAGHSLTGNQACYRLYRTADGRHMAVAALEPHFWARFCAVIERPDLVARQNDPAAQPALIAEVAQVIAARPLAEWAARFADVDACVTPVLTVAEAAREGEASLGLPAV